MALPTPVDSQITDAAAEAGVQITAEAPAIALGSLYQSTAQALGIAAHNAVTAQQQNAISMQAATAQAVMQLFSVDTAGRAAGLDAERNSALAQTLVAAASPDAVTQTIGRAVESMDRLTLDSAGAWFHAARDLMSAVADSLRDFQKVAQEAGMAAVKQAAIASTLVQMLKAPDQLEQYQKILALIEGL